MAWDNDLAVVQWAGISGYGEPRTLSVTRATDEGAIPVRFRRRLGRLERLAVRCALGVLKGEPTDELIFCSRYGNLETLLTLLGSLAAHDLLSPTAFSGSVHNATPGHIGQILNERLSHTAVAGGARTLAAGLIEAYARLVCDSCSSVTVIYADLALPPVFNELSDEANHDLAFAVRLALAAASENCGPNGRRVERVGEGWAGAQELFLALERGASAIAVGPLTSAREVA